MFFKKNKKPAAKVSGHLKAYILWPVVIGIMLIVLNIFMYFINVKSGTIMSIFMVIYAVIFIIMFVYFRTGIMHDIVEFASNYSQVQKKLLNELTMPYALLDENGKGLWINDAMSVLIGKDKSYKKGIYNIFPEITSKVLPEDNNTVRISFTYNNRDFSVELKKIETQIMMEGVPMIEAAQDSGFYAMYMYDETDINKYIQKIKDDRFVVGMIYLDNYEEALDSIDDVRRSLFIGLIDKKINKYFAPGAAIIRKLEKDKYLIVFKHSSLDKFMEDKFSIVEDIKSVKVGNEMNLTISCGIGTGANDYAKNYEVSKAAMDLALGRGGDQVVVKDGNKINYFGGKSQQMEKNTRVKVRVKAHALKQILDNNESVLIMGHKLSDVDSFGSAVGIYAIAKKMNKKAHIVINEISSSVQPFMDKFINNPDYSSDMFMKSEQAINALTPTTVVIVVDVNRAKITECPELLEKCKTLIVIDHHRQTNEPIDGAVLSYVDPYASSASEMIAEMIQYVDDGIRLKAIEADAMYAGIIIDTDSFNNKSGPRTFEAAAFLRRHGTDVTRVRKMLRNDMNEHRAIAEAVSRAEVYDNAFAITVFNGEGVKSPTIGGAQAANELLDIIGIKASFAVTEYNGQIYISARSIDEINVQLIMEKFGGGGHMSIAGAQLQDSTVEDAVARLKEVLEEMIREGEV